MAQLDPHAQHVGGPGQRHGGHRWMMIACCIPMLLIALALVLTGVANAGTIAFAFACTAMMAGMGHGSSDKLRPRCRHERLVMRSAVSPMAAGTKGGVVP